MWLTLSIRAKQRGAHTWGSQEAMLKSRPKWTLHPHLFAAKPLAWQKYLALPLSRYWICHPPLPVSWTNVKPILPVVIFCTMSSTIALKEMILSKRRISKKVNTRLFKGYNLWNWWLLCRGMRHPFFMNCFTDDHTYTSILTSVLRISCCPMAGWHQCLSKSTDLI